MKRQDCFRGDTSDITKKRCIKARSEEDRSLRNPDDFLKVEVCANGDGNLQSPLKPQRKAHNPRICSGDSRRGYVRVKGGYAEFQFIGHE
jgi:hypothetical protein